jgi:hypothetical protein
MATVALVEALMAEDLDAAGKALQARAQAIAEGEPPTEEIVALGEHAAALLQNARHRVALEATRLGRLQRSLARRPSAPQIDLQA